MQADAARLKKFAAMTDPKRRTYAAMMVAMDEAVGLVRKKLAETGQEQNTLVAFISDNGGPTMQGVTVNGSVNTPLRGSKRTTLEGGIRVPFVISWPGTVKPAVYEKPVIQLDLTATAVAVAGVETSLEGVNLLPYLSGEKTTAPHDKLYWRMGEQMAIRSGDFKLVRYDGNADANDGGRHPVTAAKLYNLATDLGESHDLAAEMPDTVKLLQTQWDAWNHANVEPLWGAKTKGAGRKKNQKKAE